MTLRLRLAALGAAIVAALIVLLPGTAQAAQSAVTNCSLRFTSQLGLTINTTNTTWTNPCGHTYVSSTNGIQDVWDNSGPLCVYFGSTLAGCGSKGQHLYIGNRSGQQATFKPQPIGSLAA
jgi:hypothetical protein